MKKKNAKIFITAIVMSSVIFSCEKSSGERNSGAVSEISAAKETADSAAVSYAAKQEIEGKKFVKTADVDMEVKDVYDATIRIENSLKDLGGFVTLSKLTANVVSENTYNTSDEKAVLVKKFQTENSIQVKVPTEKLSDFLKFVNDEKLFLNHRNISAEDVSANIKLQELEAQRTKKNAENISQLKPGKTHVEADDENMREANARKISEINLQDSLKYSTVDIFIKEPKIRTADIPVTNTESTDNKYKFNFLYDLKNAFVQGFYFLQRLFVMLVSVWPLMIILAGLVYFLIKKPIIKSQKKTD